MTQSDEQYKTLPGTDRVARLWMIGSLVCGMLAVLAVGIVLYQQSIGAMVTADLVINRGVVLRELESAFSVMKDAEIGQRGYLLTANDAYLQPYSAAVGSIDAKMNKLITSTIDDPIQQALLAKVAVPIREKFAELELTIKLRRTAGFDGALSVVKNDTGKKFMDEIRLDFQAMQMQERKLLDVSKALLQSQLRNIINTFTCWAILSVALCVAFGYATRRYLTAINNLRENLIERSELREEQAELLQLTYDAIMVRDLKDGTIKYWNKGAHDLYGFTSEEAIGRKSHELLKTQFPTALEEIEKEAPAVGHWEGELIQTTKDGRKLTVASRWRFKADVTGQLSSIMETDITGRKRHEEEILRAKEEKLEQQERSNEELLELTYDAIMVRNLVDGKIRYWNKGAQDLYGYTSAEAIGRLSTELLKTEFPTALEEIEKEAPAVGHWEGELIQTTKDGRKLTVASRWRFKTDVDGHLSSIMETDITERKRNEEEILRAKLEKVEQQERSNEELLELTYDAIMVRNLTDGKIRYWNKGAQDLYGYTAEEAIGRLSTELLKTEFPTALEEIEKEAPAVGHWEGELIQTTKDGRKLTVASRWRFKADVDGHLSSIMETDITERKRNEEEILRAKLEKVEQQERSNEELLELTYDAIMVRNLIDGKIRYWNKGAQDLYGYTAEEAIGRLSTELLKTEFPTALEEIEKEAPAVGHWEGELIQTTKDGRKLTVASRWRFKADVDGHLSSIMETDITERKRNEEEILQAKLAKIEQQERSNEELLELTFDAIMVRNLTDGRIRYWNKGAQDLYGFTSAEAIGQLSTELLKTEFPTALEEIEKEAPAVGHWEGELIQTTKDGRKLTVASRWRFKADAEGHLSSIMETDISERKRNEETILRAKEEKLLELERSNEELQQFAYVCSHDLQEPLRVISNFSQLLGVRYKGKLDEKGDQFIEFIVDGSKRMQNLINDLLVFSRVQTKGQVFGTIDCLNSVNMARANLQLLIQETGATLLVDQLPNVKGDTTQLMQLFQNILANALKFKTPGITPDIHISADKKGDDWQFAISDNGVGLDMQFAERIFVIFQRLHTKEKYPGSGLGLAVCKKIVQRHGGRIWVDSKPGEGTTFYFTIPTMTAGERN